MLLIIYFKFNICFLFNQNPWRKSWRWSANPASRPWSVMWKARCQTVPATTRTRYYSAQPLSCQIPGPTTSRTIKNTRKKSTNQENQWLASNLSLGRNKIQRFNWWMDLSVVSKFRSITKLSAETQRKILTKNIWKSSNCLSGCLLHWSFGINDLNEVVLHAIEIKL